MKPKLITSFLSMAFILLVAAPGFASFESIKHEFLMRGRVLDVKGDSAYLCIGNAGWAQVLGQKFTVYRFVRTGSMSPKPSLKYRREAAGKVKITEIIDDHMANATIISGEVREQDIAELK